MIKFATATKPEPLGRSLFVGMSYGLAIWTTALAVAQMVSFEDFVEALREYHVAGERGVLLLAVVLLALEIFSVPFLLRLWLSRAARFVSALFAIVAPLSWTLLTAIVTVRAMRISNAGMFGGLIHVPLVAALLIGLAWLLLMVLAFGVMGGRKAVSIK